MPLSTADVYSIIIAVHPAASDKTISSPSSTTDSASDWRLGEITVDWVDFTREKSTDAREKRGESRADNDESEDDTQQPRIPGAAMKPKPRKRKLKQPETPDSLSRQTLLAHIPGGTPVPIAATSASGVTEVGRGVVHLFKHAPPASLVARLEGQNGESSRVPPDAEGWAGEHAEGGDGSLIAILAVPAWMRPADFLEFIGGWSTCLEGVRMIREATTPNRSIVLLKFRDPLQANDFMVIFTGRAFSTLDSRETCHAIRIHHLVLHKLEDGKDGDVTVPVPAFPPSVYASRALPNLLTGVDADKSELPSCPVCLERLDSTVTGLVTLPCAHTFDCDCLRKWGDSRCPVCRVSHLLLSSAGKPTAQDHDEATRLTRCGMCDNAEDNWICVVCGVVGCGRYSKAHARRHWEESGHQLAMELETQRVWDYKGDNYVHRLIQTRTDGKLVELPSASSLVAAVHTRTMPLNRPIDDTPPLRDSGDSNSRTTPPTVGARDEDADHAGPSTNDMEKMSTIEAITLEYSYLLSSQLEAMRQHYESESAVQVARIASLEADNERVRGAEAAAASAEAARVAAEAAREKAEARAAKAADVTRALQTTLGSERSMAEGLQARISKMRADLDAARAARDDASGQVRALEETVRDLMFSLEAGLKIQEGGGAEAGEGGDLVVVGGKKKKKK